LLPILNDNRPLPVIETDQPQWMPINTSSPTTASGNVICDACSLDFADFMANTISVDPGDGSIKVEQLARQVDARKNAALAKTPA
jgi:hypothetical protein